MEIQKEILINTDAESIYAALTTAKGINSWYATNAVVGTKVGDIHKIEFLKEGKPHRLEWEIETLEPNKKVVWKCIKQTYAVWLDSKITFEIKGNKLHLSHLDLGKHFEDIPRVELISESWTYLLNNIRQYCITGESHPW